MSAIEGIQSTSSNKVSPDFDGLSHVLPSTFVSNGESRLTIKVADGDVKAPYMAISALPWGDHATWQYSPGELPGTRKHGKY
jgi:hypothetical protein